MRPKQLVIIGGGTSISEGIKGGLWDKLKGKWTIGLNYSFKYFDSTMLCYVDRDFYKKGSSAYSKEEKIAHLNDLKSLPLIVGKPHQVIKEPFDNTILLPTNDAIYRRDVKLGCYKSSLVGIYALSLAIYLMEEGEIYLLGYDYGCKDETKDKNGRRITHFYQGEIHHRGIGKVNFYRGRLQGNPRADKDFGVYNKETKVKIYNVSTISKINNFPKITYEEFFRNLNKIHYDQDAIRQEVKRKLLCNCKVPCKNCTCKEKK